MTDSTIPAAGPGDRALALGDNLVRIHDGFRAELAALRAHIDTVADRGAPAESLPTPPLDHQLRKNCLAFCDKLHGHHFNEDTHMLPGLAQAAPELAPVLDRLRSEHVVIGRILDDLQALLARIGTDGAESLRSEFERLAGELEAHLDYEEEQVVDALNAIQMPA